MLLGYEIVITLLFIAVVAWAWRSRDPFDVGAIVGGFMLWGFDWLWCSRGFWNATIAPGLQTMIPGLDIQGVQYPFSICFIWAVGFGFVPLFASKHQPAIRRALGPLHLPVVLAAGALIDWTVETICTETLGVWQYHQAPQYLLRGVPYSNLWFLGGLLALTYLGLPHARRWAALPPRAGLSLAKETTWKGLLMAAATVLVPAFALGCAQLFWWSGRHPWIESARPF